MRRKAEKDLKNMEGHSVVILESLEFPLLMILHLGCSISLHIMCPESLDTELHSFFTMWFYDFHVGLHCTFPYVTDCPSL